MCYNISVTDFGKGKRLRDYCPDLRDPKKFCDQILEVVRRDSVIEGLPDFDEAFEAYLRQRLMRPA